MDREEAIREATRRLTDYFQPERIYLFGSAARGEAGPDSDLDFMVSDDAQERLLRAGEGDFNVRGLGPVDVLIWRANPHCGLIEGFLLLNPSIRNSA